MLATNRSGRVLLKDDQSAQAVVRGRALEVAQLVVENPGRIPVTVYSPGLAFSGHEKEAFGGAENVQGWWAVRPGRPAHGQHRAHRALRAGDFMLDFWSVMPGILKDTPTGEVVVRGQIDVAGKRRLRRSSWWRRWKIHNGMYTALENSPDFTPYAVGLGSDVSTPAQVRGGQARHAPNARWRVTRGTVGFLLDKVMSGFAVRPEDERFVGAMDAAPEASTARSTPAPGWRPSMRIRAGPHARQFGQMV